MDAHFANKVSFFIKPDGTTHIRFIYAANDATEGDIDICTMVLPSEVALNLSKMIATGLINEKILVEQASKKTERKN